MFFYYLQFGSVRGNCYGTGGGTVSRVSDSIWDFTNDGHIVMAGSGNGTVLNAVDDPNDGSFYCAV